MQSNGTYHRMYENEVDQLFGNKLEHYQEPGNGGNWEALEQRLDEHDRNRRKKTGYGKWLVSLLLLTGITSGVVYFTNQKSNKNSGTTIATTEQSTHSQPVNTNPLPEQNSNPQNTAANNPSTNENTNNNSTLNSPAGNTTTSTPASGEPVATSSTQNSNMPVEPAFTGTQQASPSFATAVVNNNKTAGRRMNSPGTIVRHNNTGRKQKNTTVAAPPVESIQTEEQQQEATEETAPAVNTVQNETKKQPAITETPNTTTEQNTTAANNTPVAANNNVAATPSQKETLAATADNNNNLALNNTGATNNNAAIPVTKKTKTKKERVRREAPEHEFSSGQGQWYVEAFSGYNSSIKDNKSFAAFLAPAGYVDKRLQQENTLLSLQAGVNVKYRRNHLIFGAGLSYLELGDMVNYDASLSGPVALNANGRAKLTYLEIPLSLGYDWASKRWGFSLQGGISAGVLMGARGQYVSASAFNSGLFNLEDNKSMFRKTQLNLLVAPSVNYFLNEHTNLFVAPLYRLNLQPVTITGASLNQKYYGMGLRVGIRTSLRR